MGPFVPWDVLSWDFLSVHRILYKLVGIMPFKKKLRTDLELKHLETSVSELRLTVICNHLNSRNPVPITGPGV